MSLFKNSHRGAKKELPDLPHGAQGTKCDTRLPFILGYKDTRENSITEGPGWTETNFTAGNQTLNFKKLDLFHFYRIPVSNFNPKLRQDSTHNWHTWVCLGKLNGQMVLAKFLHA